MGKYFVGITAIVFVFVFGKVGIFEDPSVRRVLVCSNNSNCQQALIGHCNRPHFHTATVHTSIGLLTKFHKILKNENEEEC